MAYLLKLILELPFLYLTAAFAVVVSTLVLLWDVHKWKRNRPILKIEIESHSRLAYDIQKGGIGESQWKTITVTNIGTQMTTLKKITLLHTGRTKANNREESITVGNVNHGLPFSLEPGKQWDGYPQGHNQSYMTPGEKGRYLLVYHSMSEKPARLKLE